MHLDRISVILAGLIAFVSWAFLTDWIPLLRWVPYAFVAGVVATVGLLLFLVLSTSKGVYYREDGGEGDGRLPVAPAFTSVKRWEEEIDTLLVYVRISSTYPTMQ